MLNDLDIFYHIANPAQAYVYARVPLPLDSGPWQLTGKVRGPFTSRGHTLPSTSQFHSDNAKNPVPSSATLLSRASIIDPCTWSPDAPNLYEATIELRRDDQVVSTASHKFGLRQLQVQRKNLRFDAKRWVLRGAHATDPIPEPQSWGESTTARVMTSIDESWLNQGSRAGALSVVRLDQRPNLDVYVLRQVARHTSAAMVVIPSANSFPENVRLFAPNLILAQQVSADQPLAAWAHAAWVEFDSLEQFSRLTVSLDLPIIAVRRGEFAALGEARAAIDQLQADLAPIGQFAGYVV